MKRVSLSIAFLLGILFTAQAQIQVRWLSDTIYEAAANNFTLPGPRAIVTGVSQGRFINTSTSLGGPGWNCLSTSNPYPLSGFFGNHGDTLILSNHPSLYGQSYPEGRYDLTLYNDSSCPGCFDKKVFLSKALYYKRSTPYVAPTYTITPAQAQPGQTLDITITAPSRLEQGSSVLWIDFASVTNPGQNYCGPFCNGQSPYEILTYYNSFAVTSPTTAVANITVPPYLPLGHYDWMANARDTGCTYHLNGFEVVGNPRQAPIRKAISTAMYLQT